MTDSNRRVYYKIGEWAYFDREYGKGKPISRRIARRRLKRELDREPEEA